MPKKKYFTEEEKQQAKKIYRERDNLKKKLRYKLDKKFREKEKKRTRLYHHNNPHIALKIRINRKNRMKTDLKYRNHILQVRKKYLIKNKKLIKEQRRLYFLKNKKKLYQKNKEWKNKNKIKFSLWRKIYEKLPHVRNSINERIRKRMKTDPIFRLRRNLRLRLYEYIKYNKGKKYGSMQELLGCDWIKFKKHIESKFVKNMNWNNYGDWHIDHIIPISKFNLLIKSEQFKACNYKNLQPLWRIDNILKSDKIINN